MNVIKKEAKSFLGQIAKSNETAYLVLLSLYVAVFAMLEVGWKRTVETPTDLIRGAMLGLIMWGAALYLVYVIAEWKKLWNNLPRLIIVAVAILGLTFWFSRIMTTNLYGVVFDIFFCLMACGKNYKKILTCTGTVALVCLIIAGLGLPLGYTLDVMKPENIHPGHSLGIAYPNTWGFLCFYVLMIVWYLYFRRKKVITFILFGVTAVFMYFYICCRTVALLTIFFPFATVVVDWLENKADEKAVQGATGSVLLKVVRWIVIIMPFLMLGVMLLLSLNLEWVHAHFYYTWFHNLAMRFVVGGLFLRQHGVAFIGNVLQTNVLRFVRVNNEFIEVKILDSSFATYLLMRGILWITYTLAWLCVGMWKAIKKRDFAIPFLSAIILVFAMVERPGLEMWFNFIMLYPLAKVTSKPGTERVLEFDDDEAPVENELEVSESS